MKKNINFEVVNDSGDGRIFCHLCSGVTRKHEPFACSADETDEKLKHGQIQACGICLSSGDIDARIEGRAAELEDEAATIREMKGRIDVPSLWKQMKAAGYFVTEAEVEYVVHPRIFRIH